MGSIAPMVKILERTEIMGDVPTRRNGCGKTLRVKSGRVTLWGMSISLLVTAAPQG
jgi:hypothetical protein